MTTKSRNYIAELARQCLAELLKEPNADRRTALLEQHDLALQLLEQEVRPSTAVLAERVGLLEERLAYMDRGDRARAIMERLHLSKPWYYKLRKIFRESPVRVDRRLVK